MPNSSRIDNVMDQVRKSTWKGPGETKRDILLESEWRLLDVYNYSAKVVRLTITCAPISLRSWRERPGKYVAMIG